MANRPPKTERVFFALWPDDALRGALHALAQGWRAHCGGRVTRRENLHLTLVFIGNVDPQQLAVLRDLAARQVVHPFDLELNAGRYFKRNRIVSAQPTAAPAVLRDMVAGLAQSLRVSGVPFDATLCAACEFAARRGARAGAGDRAAAGVARRSVVSRLFATGRDWRHL